MPQLKILYLSSTELDYALNAVCIKGLKENGAEVMSFKVRKGWNFLRSFNLWKGSLKKADLIIAGYDSPFVAIVLRFLSRKKIIYNAIHSSYERLIVSRKLASRFSVKSFYHWLLDLVAIHLADLTLVETDHQGDYFRKLFKVSGNKIFRSWGGVEESKFFYKPSVQKKDKFTVIFRGRFLPEAGADIVVLAAKRLESQGVDFELLGGGHELPQVRKLVEELKPANLKLITEFFSQDRLNEIMQAAHLSLGQLSDHERLDRTIPHKAFESLAVKVPYLTASNIGVLELLTPDKTCLTCNPADAKSLADKILWTKDNYSKAQEIAENGYKLYQDKLRHRILAKNLLDRISTI